MASQTVNETKKAQAKRALRSLAVGIAVPLILTLTIIILFGSGRKYRSLVKPFWFAPLWFIHLATLGSSFFMGLAAWLVWADGGFQGESDALSLYVAQVSLSIVWHPLVLVMSAYWLASVSCLVNFGTLFLCYLRFKKVNPFAKDLAKPCLVWAAYLTLISFKLIFL
ncbi:translocator protein homolog [Gastrolobium bilobum]|uniref:translocator protein homolog n=1 Tax=Gastrolobium bilobum TaxID=150636 RepID=UPI002AB0FBB9|nr:translocator protein homolog [Gastrolobium bilobum]